MYVSNDNSILSQTKFAHFIQVVSMHIDDVEALGDIGTVNRNEIGRVLSKNRQL